LTNKLKFIAGASLGIAAAMLTKGPIGLVMPALALGGHIMLKKQWRLLFDWKWILMLFGVTILLIPMCVGLFKQYGKEGLTFYFWTQSFGRITGESTWENDTTALYFTHVFLWSFLPWVFLAIAALLSELKNVPKLIANKHSELYLISGIVLVSVALSLSRFKLPHYIFVVYPLIAILTAKYVNQLQKFSSWAWIQLTLSTISVVTLAVLLKYCFPNGGWVMPIILMLFVVSAVMYFLMAYRSSQVLKPSFILSIAIGLGLNLHFYPQLLKYQANAQVGKWVNENQIEEGKLIGFATGGRAFDFYGGGIVPWMNDVASTIEAIEPGIIVYANQARYNELKKYSVLPKEEIVFENFEVQKLTVKFLNPETRDKTLRKNYLLFY
jgi:4-amino-4-deoxy-L-arabinose transferase-like glycosyltransferase